MCYQSWWRICIKTYCKQYHAKLRIAWPFQMLPQREENFKSHHVKVSSWLRSSSVIHDASKQVVIDSSLLHTNITCCNNLDRDRIYRNNLAISLQWYHRRHARVIFVFHHVPLHDLSPNTAGRKSRDIW